MDGSPVPAAYAYAFAFDFAFDFDFEFEFEFYFAFDFDFDFDFPFSFSSAFTLAFAKTILGRENALTRAVNCSSCYCRIGEKTRSAEEAGVLILVHGRPVDHQIVRQCCSELSDILHFI